MAQCASASCRPQAHADGEVTVADVNAVILFILNATRDAEAELPADVNCDGEVTIADINMIISIIIGGA